MNNKRNYQNKNTGGEIRGLSVEVRNDDFNKALRRFKKIVQEDGILQEYRERQEYTTPSEKRKKAKAAARSRWLKKQAKSNLNTKRLY